MSRVALLCLLSLCGCKKSEPTPAPFVPPTDGVRLPIPDRQWAEGAPDEGWCGETSIQMAALHYGAWVPQPVINALGRSTHVDLWEEDIPTALDRLGLKYERGPSTGRDQFLSWIIGHVRRGHPVIVGAKLFPTDHPDWDVDHLMPVVGFSARGLVFNSNLDEGQVEVTWAALGGRQSISFASPTGKLYGFAILGFPDAGPRVALRVLEESAETLTLAVETDAVVLSRDDLDGGVTLTREKKLTIPRTQSARFSAQAGGR
ncbi:MAG: hypothetical protein Q8L48_42590 [Archangium sp.]|nr:hypothetical protein [Archangium sp.]